MLEVGEAVGSVWQQG